MKPSGVDYVLATLVVVMFVLGALVVISQILVHLFGNLL